MDGKSPDSRKRSDGSYLERKLKQLTVWRRISNVSPVEIVGELGLNLLFEPSKPLVEFIFVHGLRGGSRKTWSATPSPNDYWPKEWLPKDPDFKHVRIYSFGYNSDWLDRRESFLSVHDFAQSLMEEIQNNGSIRRSSTRIVLIGHSLGGLVIKKACILSRENPAFKELGHRIHSLYFLATPHRGSDLAQTLHNLLKVLPTGNKPFVGSLKRGSETINILNDQFRHCEGIVIRSFTESLPMSLGTRESLIVDLQSATLGYPGERVQALNANHRTICKFESTKDSNYRTLRNNLASTVDDIQRIEERQSRKKCHDEMQRLLKFLDITQHPMYDKSTLEYARTPDTCDWIINDESFLHWQLAQNAPRYFWLSGRPGVGKSVITAHVINSLDKNSCSYYFFKQGGRNKSSLRGLLLSIAYQMADQSQSIRTLLLNFAEYDSLLNKDDYRIIWQRIFVEGIFCTDFKATQYWVIDAFDECQLVDTKSFINFFAALGQIDENIPIKIFISSRPSSDLERSFTKLDFVNLQVSTEVSLRDIQIFVEKQVEELPIETDDVPKDLIESLVRQSGGSFLWTVLVMQQLEGIYSIDEIEEILQKVPEEMDDLYVRNLQIIDSFTRTKKLAHTVLIWTLFATRPLAIEELKAAIELDLKIKVARDLAKSISTLCSQFVFVDNHGRVNIVHETARTFLLNSKLESDLRIHLLTADVRLGLTCLEYLTSDEMEMRRGAGSKSLLQDSMRNNLSDYACSWFSSHLAQSTTFSDPLLLTLTKFIHTNILVWIEKIAEKNDLICLVRTAGDLNQYRMFVLKHLSSLPNDITLWANDLPRLVTEFGTTLSKHPTAIYDLIPPLCPQNSAIHRQFGLSCTSLQVRGLSNSEWDDRISSWRFDKIARCVTSQGHWFAISVSQGLIIIYKSSTCQEVMRMDHGETIRILRFGSSAKFLVSSASHTIKLWDVSTGSLLWKHKINSNALSVDFDDINGRVIVATRLKELYMWAISDGTLHSHHNWHRNLPDEDQHIIPRAPFHVVISSSHKLMAVAYRNMPLCLWDIESMQQLGLCSKRSDDGSDTSNNIVSVCFNPVQMMHLLAVSYIDGDVAIFDTKTLIMKAHAQAGIYVMAASPDGRILAGGDATGTFKLFDFETMQPLYRVSLSADGISALAFTSDSLRVIDLRGTQVNVWEPSTLIRRQEHGDKVRRKFFSEEIWPSLQDSEIEIVDQERDITKVIVAYHGTWAICGRDDGAVDICNLTTTEPVCQELYKHSGSYMSVLAMDWNDQHQIIATADVSSRFIVTKITKDATENIIIQEEILTARMSFGHQVNQLLICSDASTILVSSSTGDFIWSLHTGKLMASREVEDRMDWRWFRHPHISTEFVLLTDSLLQSFSWNDSGSFVPISVVSLRTEAGQNLDLKGALLCRDKNILITKATSENILKAIGESHSTQISIQVSSFIESNLQPTSLNCQPLLSPQKIGLPHIKALLGTLSDILGATLLLFIAEDGWVCSVDLDCPALSDSFQRYFVIPSAWLSLARSVISVVTERKDILFVRGHELAVIKNGLEIFETT